MPRRGPPTVVAVAAAAAAVLAACSSAVPPHPAATASGGTHGSGTPVPTASAPGGSGPPAPGGSGPPATGTSPASTPGGTTSSSGAGGVPAFSHVFVVVMENLSYDAAMATPGFASLAHRYAAATAYYAASHPSLPNYLALAAGSTFGIASDCLSCFVTGDNLGAELGRAGISWNAYFEGVSASCYLGTSYGVYAAKHNPFRYFTDVRSSQALCSHLVPLAQLGPALAGPASGVPRFVWVTPNVCNDGHSCPASQAAAWLDGLVAEVTASQAWRQDGVLFVTWDEGAGGDSRQATPRGSVLPTGGGGHVLTLVVAPGVPPGTVVTTPLSHYALLATVEDALGVPLLGQAAAWSRRTLAGFFAAPPTGSPL